MAVWRGSEELRVRLLPSCPPVLVSSYVSGRADRPRSAGSAFGNEVRHIIATRDEARPHALAADQQGRWSLPARAGLASGWGMAVSGWDEEGKG